MIDRCDEIREGLISFAEGELAPARHHRVAAHLGGCAACAREAERLAEVLSRTRALPTPEMPEAFWADFGAVVRQRVAAEAPPRAPFFRRVGTRRDRLRWLRLVPALGAAVAAGVLLAFGLARTPRVPPSPPSAESVAVGDSLAIAQHLDVLQHLDELENLELLEQLTVLQAPELGRLPARS
jgi:anti-sigma factor RsiW